MAEQPRILVVGSINMDLTIRCSERPAPGETILGGQFLTSPGGKGANQAVAAARLGAKVTMIGRVGQDAFGRDLRDTLASQGIDVDCVEYVHETPSGVAMIVVDGHGENSIVVASGANDSLTPDDVFSCEELFRNADVVLLQLELPLPTVRAAIEKAHRNGCKVVLDPAPVPRHFPQELYQVDVISPNCGEAEKLTGYKASPDERMDKSVALELIARGAQAAVLKLGSRGAMVVTADEQIATVPAFRKTVADTTGAGDAFTAALGVGIAQGRSLPEAALFANAAGALACTRLGAQSALPTLQEVRMLLAENHE